MSRQQPTEAQHYVIWSTIEAIAKANNKSLSALALVAGMDSTSLNKSKRMSGQKMRMPTTTTIMAILKTAQMDWFDWAHMYKKTAEALGLINNGQKDTK